MLKTFLPLRIYFVLMYHLHIVCFCRLQVIQVNITFTINFIPEIWNTKFETSSPELLSISIKTSHKLYKYYMYATSPKLWYTTHIVKLKYPIATNYTEQITAPVPAQFSSQSHPVLLMAMPLSSFLNPIGNHGNHVFMSLDIYYSYGPALTDSAT